MKIKAEINTYPIIGEADIIVDFYDIKDETIEMKLEYLKSLKGAIQNYIDVMKTFKQEKENGN